MPGRNTVDRVTNQAEYSLNLYSAPRVPGTQPEMLTMMIADHLSMSILELHTGVCINQQRFL
jgi:hypothetical protein